MSAIPTDLRARPLSASVRRQGSVEDAPRCKKTLRRGGGGPMLAGSLSLLTSLSACAVHAGDRGTEQSARATARSAPAAATASGTLRSLDGFFPLAVDPSRGRVILEVTHLEQPFLYLVGLPGGLGSNDVGLDRGQLGARHVLEFRRVGPKVLLVAPNLEWRSSSAEEAVRARQRSAFAESVLWSFVPLAEDDAGYRPGALRVDATPFLLRDAHGIASTLATRGQGEFTLDAERSLVLPDSVKAFPENVQIDALETFASRRPGEEVQATTPVPEAVTLRVRHALIALPDAEAHAYRPRAHHPRSGFFAHAWNDSAVPLGADTTQRVLPRHHVTAEEPLVYYVDSAAPEPVRTALLEGARFWEPVFDRAIFPGAFRAELLPEGADPDDARWNVVQWVERSTRGWSYGDSVLDPRSGEILKGHVTLGALRVRQDVLLFEGLTGPWRDGALDPAVTEAALARIRQLSAHEIGHTLGLTHNFAASTNERASVMDYPAPRVRLDAAGAVDLAEAYAPGCGAWDELAIRYGYGAFEDEAAGLRTVLAEMEARGLAFASDADARGSDRAHPLANLWDEGADPVAQLELELAVRAAALARFDASVLDPTRSTFDYERALLPLYLRHRYQLEAVVRQVGGRWYAHALVAEGANDVRPVEAQVQREALAAAVAALEPGVLRLPDAVLRRLTPPPPGHARDRETFAPSGPLFDAERAAAGAADLVLGFVLEPARCARLVQQADADPAQLGLDELLEALVARWFPDASAHPPGADPVARNLEDVVRERLLVRLLALADEASASGRVRARALVAAERIRARLSAARDAPELPFGRRTPFLLETLRRYFEEPRSGALGLPSLELPPGSPIGCEEPTFGLGSF